MPSVLLGQPDASGAIQLVSGNPWSGNKAFHPITGIQLKMDPLASGNCYVGLSGSVTANSGGYALSGGNYGLSGEGQFTDGIPLARGDSYFVPREATGLSGTIDIYVRHDAAVSGQARLYYEIL